jgi:hypothetical protein
MHLFLKRSIALFQLLLIVLVLFLVLLTALLDPCVVFQFLSQFTQDTVLKSLELAQ